MRNAIIHLTAQRAKRKEQHMRIETRTVDELLSGVNQQVDTINELHAQIHELKKQLASRGEEYSKLLRKLEKASSSAA